MANLLTALDLAKRLIDNNKWTEQSFETSLKNLADIIAILPRHQFSDLHIYFNQHVSEKLKIDDFKKFKKLIQKH